MAMATASTSPRRHTHAATLLMLLGATVLHQSAACNLGMLRDIDGITPICCGSMTGASASDDCSSGFPARCSPACAELLVPFWDDCEATMQMMGASFFTFDVHAMADFMSPCQQTASLTASAAQTCAAPTADTQLESWVEEVNDACCSQHGINVCRDGDAVPWQCNAPCATTFIPFAEQCLGFGGASPPPPSADMDSFFNLYSTCANMNTDNPAEVALLLADVNVLVDDDHCIIDTSGIVSASITAANSRPLAVRENTGGGNTCMDDDAFVASAFANPGLTCASASAQGMCPVLEASGIQNRESPHLLPRPRFASEMRADI